MAKTISAEVASFFEETELMGRVTNGRRSISVSVLSSPFFRASSSSRNISSASFSTAFDTEPQRTIDVPAELESIEAYEYIGFNRETSRHLWSCYANQKRDSKDSFMDIARAHVRNHQFPDVIALEEDWVSLLGDLGINDKLQTAILLPEFSDVRVTMTCKYWVSMSMEWGFSTLAELDDRLREELRRRKPGVGQQKAKTPTLDPPVSRKRSKEPTGPVLASASEDDAKPVTTSAAGFPPKMDGYTMVWCACKLPLALGCCNDEEDQLCLDNLKFGQGDFPKGVEYFTPQPETANRYATYYKHLQEDSEFATLQIAVPTKFIESLDHGLLLSDGNTQTQWKKVIWYCRRGDGDALPRELKYLYRRELWIGHIARGKDKKYIDMESWEEVDSSRILKVKSDGKWINAIQWVFYTEFARTKFAKLGKGNAWVHYRGSLVSEMPKQQLGA